MTQFSFIIIKWSLKKAQGFTIFLRNNLECFFTTTLIKGSVPYSFAQFVSILKHLHDNCRTFQFFKEARVCVGQTSWRNIVVNSLAPSSNLVIVPLDEQFWRLEIIIRCNLARDIHTFFFVQCKRTQIKRWHTLFDEP